METDKNKISEWFYMYSTDIYHYLIYFTGSHDVEDLVQEVFYRAIKGLDSYDGRAVPKTWLFGIARHVGIDEIRKQKRLHLKHTLSFGNEDEPKLDMTPEDLCLISEKQEILYKAILSLKKNYRDVLILRGIKDLTVTEVSDILGWNENKVRITFHRALKALQKVKGRLSQ
ncbi:RNA polymerase sigma factor [Thalassobacillus sp. CUG 92003]|uniref:RNA polymerase sigma factor n=1 Tax=Thalassobacillus sp. CUG 92003 TaxID=2736641 RepID=UPI0015E650B8|nr:RNA polymerase sigma factor [Thalassobacillus sp. CUG 92003]